MSCLCVLIQSAAFLQGVQALTAFQNAKHSCQIDTHCLITTERQDIYLLSCY